MMSFSIVICPQNKNFSTDLLGKFELWAKKSSKVTDYVACHETGDKGNNHHLDCVIVKSSYSSTNNLLRDVKKYVYSIQDGDIAKRTYRCAAIKEKDIEYRVGYCVKERGERVTNIPEAILEKNRASYQESAPRKKCNIRKLPKSERRKLALIEQYKRSKDPVMYMFQDILGYCKQFEESDKKAWHPPNF